MNRRGFTLIELLVSIAIILILTAVVLPRLSGMTPYARDTERITDVKQLQGALESYFDRYGEYPNDGDNSWITSCGSGSGTFSSDLSTLVSDGYLSSLPSDPGDSCYEYAWGLDCTGTIVNRGYAIRFEPEVSETFEESGDAVDFGSGWYCVEM